MPRSVSRGLALLLLLHVGVAHADNPLLSGPCAPRDSTPECCLKQFPTSFERCYGSLEFAPTPHSVALRVTAALTATAVAAHPVLIPAERRGTQLASNLLSKVEAVLKECAVQADREVNGWLLDGISPDQALCEKLKEGHGTMATYLGNRKHVAAWLCLREKLPSLLPKDRFLLEPRFMYNARLGRWEYMDENFVSQVVHQSGWKGLEGTLRPDVVLLDEEYFIVHVYDFKFPCPENNKGRWDFYRDGPYFGKNQGQVYDEALHVTPLLVTPVDGII